MRISYRKYKKWTKCFPLIKDDNGKTLYPGDFVMVKIPTESKRTWGSRIHFTYLNGAWIDGNPGHRKMSGEGASRNLSEFWTTHYDDPEYRRLKPTCVKITFEQYLQWVEENKEQFPFLETYL